LHSVKQPDSQFYTVTMGPNPVQVTFFIVNLIHYVTHIQISLPILSLLCPENISGLGQ